MGGGDDDKDGASAAFEGTPIAVPVGPLVVQKVRPPEDDEALASSALVEQTGRDFGKVSRARAAGLIKDAAYGLDRWRPRPGAGTFVTVMTAGGLYLVGNTQAEKVGFALASAVVMVGVVWRALTWVNHNTKVWRTRRELTEQTGWPGDRVRLALNAARDARSELFDRGWEGRRLTRGVIRVVQHALSEGQSVRGKALERVARYGTGSRQQDDEPREQPRRKQKKKKKKKKNRKRR